MEELNNCVICASLKPLHKKQYQLKDHALTGEVFDISKCEECGAMLTDPRPSSQEIGKYYDFKEYISHSDDAPGVVNRLYQLARKWTTSGKINLINQVSKKRTHPRHLLDYGCGTGFFLNKAKLKGWNVTGVEVNDKARFAASQRATIAVYDQYINLPSEITYDVITLWHVLEHVHFLSSTVESLLNKLKPDGSMIIAVPNIYSMDAKSYDQWWAAYDVPRHLYHFTPLSIAKLVDRYDAKIVRQIGQPMDAYYISMLSEKYRGGNVIGALIKGLKSNISAWRTKNYSSIIYVVQRKKH